MLEFKKLTLNDINTTRDYFLFSINKACDNTVGGTFMWRDYFMTEFTEFNNTLIFKVNIKYHGGITAFSLPLGRDVAGSVLATEEYCRRLKIPLVFCKITKEEILLLEKMFRNRNVMLYKETNWSDYVYNANDLVTLAGRKYSGQRNQINKFLNAYGNYSFEVISDENLDDVKDFCDGFYKDMIKTSDVFAEDQSKTLEVLDNFDSYGLPGGLIRTGGKVAAFSVGEICNDILHVHIEKADIRYTGIYQLINNEFAKHNASDNINFINREDDAGDEGLRRAKEAYHPCEIIEKYIVEIL